MPELQRLTEIMAADARAKRRTRWGIAASIAWLVGAVGLMLWKQDNWGTLKPNEWGDVFAGVTAPLAFLWLALGYFQQGDELRQNTHALIGQEEQLQRQAEATARLVAQYERQAEATAGMLRMTAEAQARAQAEKIRLAAPRFVSGQSSWGGVVGLHLTNIGAEAHDVTLLDAGGTRAESAKRPVMKTGEQLLISMPHLAPGSYRLLFGCTDVYGLPYRITLMVDPVRGAFEVSQE